MIIFGWGRNCRVMGEVNFVDCPNCGNSSQWRIVETSRGVSLYFVPVAKWNREYFCVCPICNAGKQIRSLERAQDLLLEALEQRENAKIAVVTALTPEPASPPQVSLQKISSEPTSLFPPPRAPVVAVPRPPVAPIVKPIADPVESPSTIEQEEIQADISHEPNAIDAEVIDGPVETSHVIEEAIPTSTPATPRSPSNAIQIVAVFLVVVGVMAPAIIFNALNDNHGAETENAASAVQGDEQQFQDVPFRLELPRVEVQHDQLAPEQQGPAATSSESADLTLLKEFEDEFGHLPFDEADVPLGRITAVGEGDQSLFEVVYSRPVISAAVGENLSLFRGDAYIGQAKVLRVSDNRLVAQKVHSFPNVQVGDLAEVPDGDNQPPRQYDPRFPARQ